MPKLCRLISPWLCSFLLLLTLGAPSVFAQTEPVALKPLDPRVLILKYYLQGYDAPYQDQAEQIIADADATGLDWKLLPAIAAVESKSGHRFPAGSYNAWGYGIHSGKAFYFNSWGSAIDYISQDIKQKYLNQGLTTPEAMNIHYSTNPDWGWLVDYYVDELRDYSQAFMTKFGPQIEAYNAKIAETNRLAHIFPNQTEIKVVGSRLSLVDY